MTTATTNLKSTGFLGRVFGRLAESYEAHARTMSRRTLIERLEAKSDAELAQLGIQRDEIARYVFRDLFYA